MPVSMPGLVGFAPLRRYDMGELRRLGEFLRGRVANAPRLTANLLRQ